MTRIGLFIGVALATFFLFAIPAKSYAPILPELSSVEDMKAYATQKALEASVSPAVVHAVIACESTWNPRALGDSGHSRGLAQIHDQYHDISDEQAYDPRFAIDFLVSNLAEGKGRMWTCWRQLQS